MLLTCSIHVWGLLYIFYRKERRKICKENMNNRKLSCKCSIYKDLSLFYCAWHLSSAFGLPNLLPTFNLTILETNYGRKTAYFWIATVFLWHIKLQVVNLFKYLQPATAILAHVYSSHTKKDSAWFKKCTKFWELVFVCFSNTTNYNIRKATWEVLQWGTEKCLMCCTVPRKLFTFLDFKLSPYSMCNMFYFG